MILLENNWCNLIRYSELTEFVFVVLKEHLKAREHLRSVQWGLTKEDEGNHYVMFNKRAAVFYRVQNHEPKASDLDPTRAASLLNVFKDIRLEKRV